MLMIIKMVIENPDYAWRGSRLGSRTGFRLAMITGERSQFLSWGARRVAAANPAKPQARPCSIEFRAPRTIVDRRDATFL
jgi:hypothetical protein